MAIITLQAKRPLTKADTKPSRRGREPTPAPKDASPAATLRRSRLCSPMMGMSTMRKENWAMLSRFTPVRRPVAMVLPLRETPGMTAKACARPTTKACQYDTPFRVSRATGTLKRTPALSEKRRRPAVMQRPTPTCQSSPLNRASTWSFRRKPTRATGMRDTSILHT